jgi:sugar phosphate isomerase/epimerase
MTALGLGLCSVTFRAHPFGEVLALAHEARVEGIEWGADAHAPPGDLARARTIATMSRELGIAVASYGSYLEAGAADRDAFPRVLETALALGAQNIRVWAGRRGVPSASVDAAERARCADHLRAYADAAAADNLTVSLEFHRETLTDTADSTLELLERAGRPNLFSYWQPRPGIDDESAVAELDALRERLSHLHVFHWNERGQRFALATSAPFWTPLLGRVAGWVTPRFRHRWAMLEFVRNDDPAAFAGDARTLRAWIDALTLSPDLPQDHARPDSERIA